MKVFSDLLKIKQYREDRAEIAMLRARHALEEADTAMFRARDALSECRAVSRRREHAMYLDICSKLIQLRDLENVALEMENMKVDLHRYTEAVDSAACVQASKSELLDQAKDAYWAAMRMREKFTELKTKMDAEVGARREYIEDTELEEVAGRSCERVTLMGSATDRNHA